MVELILEENMVRNAKGKILRGNKYLMTAEEKRDMAYAMMKLRTENRMRIRDIGKKYGISGTSVRNILKKYYPNIEQFRYSKYNTGK